MGRLTASGHLIASHVEEFSWAIELTTEQVRELFTTISNWTTAEVEEAARAVDDLVGRVVKHYLTPLIVMKRAAG